MTVISPISYSIIFLLFHSREHFFPLKKKYHSRHEADPDKIEQLIYQLTKYLEQYLSHINLHFDLSSASYYFLVIPLFFFSTKYIVDVNNKNCVRPTLVVILTEKKYFEVIYGLVGNIGKNNILQ